MKSIHVIKTGSRIDNKFGYLITRKSYECRIITKCMYNFVIIKIGDKIFKTDMLNLKLAE
jgi:hypothetical protein